MALFSTWYSGVIFALVLSVICIILTIFGGYVIDQVSDKLVDAPGHDSNFVAQSEGVTNFFINLYYGSLWVLFFFGWVVAAQACMKKESTSRYLG